jgi:cytidylate kinase
VVAIDGPAGTGKSTVAQRVAHGLGYSLVDTGAIYRCLALAARWAGVDESDARALAKLAANLKFRFEERGNRHQFWIGTEEVSELIREPTISQSASKISALAEVRQALLRLQRELGRSGGVVLEGRDIGTVVFPDAEVKVFLTAPLEVRAKRRYDEMIACGRAAVYDQVLEEVRQRDERDQSREVAPMRPAPDAVTIDTGPLPLDEVVQRVLGVVRDRTQGDTCAPVGKPAT